MLWIRNQVQETDRWLNHVRLWTARENKNGNKRCTGDNKKLSGEMKKSEGVFVNYTNSTYTMHTCIFCLLKMADFEGHLGSS